MLTPALYRTRITHLRRAPVHHYSNTEATAGMSTWTGCPVAAVAAAVRPLRCPRSLRRRAGRPHCVNGSNLPRRPRHRSARRHHHRTAAGQGARICLQPTEPVLVPRRRRGAAACRRRGAQHLRRQTRISAAAGRRPARDGDEEALRVAVQRRRRVLLGAGAAAGFPTRRDDFAAPGESARVRRDDARRQTTGRHRSDHWTAAGGTAGAADGFVRHPGAGHHAVAPPSAGGTAADKVAEKERVQQP